MMINKSFNMRFIYSSSSKILFKQTVILPTIEISVTNSFSGKAKHEGIEKSSCYMYVPTNVPRFDKRIVHYPEEMQTTPIYRSIDSYYILINEIESQQCRLQYTTNFRIFQKISSRARTDMFRSCIRRRIACIQQLKKFFASYSSDK